MFKFSQLITKAYKPLNLKELLGAQYFCRVFTTPAQKKRKPGKTKLSGRKKALGSTRISELLTMQDVIVDAAAANSVTPSNSQSNASNTSMPSGQEVKPPRQFEEIHFAPGTDRKMDDCGEHTGVPFTYMSYNVLAQDLLELHSYLYKSRPQYLRWDHRLSRLADEILTVRPDILCLQEVQKNHIPAFLKALWLLNFNYVFKKKTGSQSDGCAIFFNRNVFELVEKHTVEYYQPNVKYLDRENVALIAKLCVKGRPTSCFIAATTHLLYNPRRQDVRLAQVKLLLAELDHISFKGFGANGRIRRHPIILSGDFNLMPHSAPYNLITLGNLVYHNLTERTLESAVDRETFLTGHYFLPPHLGITDNCQHYDVVKDNYRGQARIQNTDKRRLLAASEAPETDTINDKNHPFSSGELHHFLNLTSVYDHRHRNEATTFQNRWITVDYIFYSQQFSPSVTSFRDGCYLQLIGRYALPSVEQCNNLNLVIPNAYLGSDHLSLAAKFVLQVGTSEETRGKSKTDSASGKSTI